MNKKVINKNAEIPEIILLGLNHKTAPLEIREKFSIDDENISGFLDKAVKCGIEEIIYLSTCNRVSIYFTANNIHDSVECIISLLEEYSGLNRDKFLEYLYKKYSRDAVLHLLSVTSSLDSMVIGENEIIGQVKKAYHLAVDNNKTGVLLNRLFHQAFSTSKKVRTETAISQNPLSIAYIAVEQADNIFKDLSGKKALLVGAGEMGELILKYFSKNNIDDITIANRSLHKAEAIVDEINSEAHVIPLDDLEIAAIEADVIITSVAVSDYILTKDKINDIIEKRAGRKLFIIDIAVPRNVDPEVSKIKNVILYNIDDLKSIADKNLKNRMKEIKVARQIINDDATDFFKWYESLEIVPIIVKLQNIFNDVRISELDRYLRRKMKHFSKDDFKLVEDITKQIMTKTLHNPIMALKRYQDSHLKGHIDLESIIEELFKI